MTMANVNQCFIKTRVGTYKIKNNQWFTSPWGHVRIISVADKALNWVEIETSSRWNKNEWNNENKGKKRENNSEFIVSICTCGGLMVSELDSQPDRVVRVRALARDIVFCSWARHLTPTVPLCTQVYKWVPANLMLGVTLRWTSIPSRGGVAIFLVA